MWKMFEWYREFSAGRLNVHDKERRDGLLDTDETVQKIKRLYW